MILFTVLGLFHQRFFSVMGGINVCARKGVGRGRRGGRRGWGGEKRGGEGVSIDLINYLTTGTGIDNK